MALDAPASDTSAVATDPARVRLLVLVSAMFLVLQVATTDYGTGLDGRGTAWFWLVIGVVLLWFVYRGRSRLARGIVVVSSLGGAVVYLLVALRTPAALLSAFFFLGQAMPLLSGPVRRHVGAAIPVVRRRRVDVRR